MRKTVQASTDARMAAESRPTFACSSCGPWKARVAISKETVKPTPAIMALTMIDAQPTCGRIRPPLSLATSHDIPTMPMGFPTT